MGTSRTIQLPQKHLCTMHCLFCNRTLHSCGCRLGIRGLGKQGCFSAVSAQLWQSPLLPLGCQPHPRVIIRASPSSVGLFGELFISLISCQTGVVVPSLLSLVPGDERSPGNARLAFTEVSTPASSWGQLGGRCWAQVFPQATLEGNAESTINTYLQMPLDCPFIFQFSSQLLALHCSTPLSHS